MAESVSPRSLTIEQKVACLSEAVGQLRHQLRNFLAVSNVALTSGLGEARKIVEFLVNRIFLHEGLEPDFELNNNIDILGGTDGKLPARRRKEATGPIPAPILPKHLHSSLHTLRIYGNHVVHPKLDRQTMELKDLQLTQADLQVVLSQIMRLLEWYFQEYPRGPRLNPLYDQMPEPIMARHGETPPDPVRFLGRQREVEHLSRLLREGSAKLVTVLAPAGMGKTLLAARVAVELASGWHNERGCLLWFDLKGAPSYDGRPRGGVLANGAGSE